MVRNSVKTSVESQFFRLAYYYSAVLEIEIEGVGEKKNRTV